MSGIVETARSLHEDVEQNIKYAILELSANLKSRKSTLQRNTIVATRIKYIRDNLQRLREIYDDEDEVFSQQLHPILELSPEDGLAHFLTAAHQVLNNYKDQPNPPMITFNDTDGSKDPFGKALVNIDDLFTSTELHGKFIDLTLFYQQFTRLSILQLYYDVYSHNALKFEPTKLFDVEESNENFYTTQQAEQRINNFLQSTTKLHKECSYETYLTVFDDMSLLIPSTLKKRASAPVLQEYLNYLKLLQEYLEKFCARLHPLLDVKTDILDEANAEFIALGYPKRKDAMGDNEESSATTVIENEAEFFATNNILGWANNNYKYYVVNHRQPYDNTPADLSSQVGNPVSSDKEHVKSYGLVMNNFEILHNFGYTCYIDTTTSTPSATTESNNDNNTQNATTSSSGQQADGESWFCAPCNKTFAKKGTYDSHLPGKQHQKMAAIYEKNNNNNTNQTSQANNNNNKFNLLPANDDNNATSQENKKQQQILYQIAKTEFMIGLLSDLLRPVITRTQQREEKRQTQSYQEMLLDNIESDEDENDTDGLGDNTNQQEADSAKIGSKLITPDGRTIPAWMYKLHGFNITFTCEICGGDIFRGERNYKTHFKDWKHTYMLKCLGIQNSDVFVDIAKIDDALTLHRKLQSIQQEQITQYEEVEDVLGNVNRIQKQ